MSHDEEDEGTARSDESPQRGSGSTGTASRTGTRSKRRGAPTGTTPRRPIIKQLRFDSDEISQLTGIANDFVSIDLDEERVTYRSRTPNPSSPHASELVSHSRSMPTTEIELARRPTTTEIELARIATAYKDPCLNPVWASLKGDKEIPDLPKEPPKEESVTEDQVEERNLDDFDVDFS